MRKIAISDIHGCSKTLKVLLDKQVGLTSDDELYLLGDYIDRGPDSKGVLDFIMEMRKQGQVVRCLMGNHELMMIESREANKESTVWRLNGGVATIESFGTSTVASIPQQYFDFLYSLEDYILVDEYILVHAGLNFEYKGNGKAKKDFLWKIKNPFLDRKSLFWLRNWHDNIDRDWLGSRVIIHGHTPISSYDIQKMNHNLEELPVLDIDNGCFAKFQAGMGHLCAYDMTNRKLYFQQNIE
ncbi:MAG: metallophosphoesterase family protein [Bacteroidota bacterium]